MAAHKRLKPVLVEWWDIVDGGGEWQNPHETPKPALVRTIGYLYQKNAKHIVVIRDFYELDGERTIGGTLAIPVGTIHRIVNLLQEKNAPRGT